MQAFQAWISPFKWIKKGGFFYLLLLIVSMGSITYAIDISFLWSVRFIEQFVNEHLEDILSPTVIYAILYAAHWIICLPVILSVTVLPLRIIYLHREFVIMEYLKELPKAFQSAVSCTWHLIRLLPYYSASLIALAIIYPHLDPYLTTAALQYSETVLIFFVVLLASTKLITILTIPIIGTLGLYDRYHSDALAREIAKRHLSTLMMLGILTIICFLSLYIGSTDENIVLLRIYFIVTYSTYMVIAFGAFLLHELAEAERIMLESG